MEKDTSQDTSWWIGFNVSWSSRNSSWTALATFLKILLSQWSEIINFSFMVKLMYVVSGCRAPPRIFFFFYLQCWLSSSFSRLQFYISLFDFCDFRNLIEKVTYACGLFLDLPFAEYCKLQYNYKICHYWQHHEEKLHVFDALYIYKFLKIFWFIPCGSKFFVIQEFSNYFYLCLWWFIKMKNNTGLKNSEERNIWTMLYKWYKKYDFI